MGLRVLIAEDQVINQFVLQEVLEVLGLTSDLANNGEEAIKMHRENPYDLILMDCVMPNVDGWEATREIRKLEDLGIIEKTAVIYALTGLSHPQDHVKCLQAGMNHTLTKPLNIDELSSRLACHFEECKNVVGMDDSSQQMYGLSGSA